MDIYSDPTPIATVEQFKTALLTVRDKVGISDTDLAMLRAHYRAPNHTISTARLAQDVGYPNFSSVNLQYGILAHHVADALHITLPPSPSGNPHWWRTLAYGNGGAPQTDDGSYEWTLRPELVRALEELPWGMKPKSDATGCPSP